MTKEQEAMKYIEKRIKVCNENADICDDNNFDEEATYLREESYMLETVLSMLKEKDRQIERLEQTLTRNIARNVIASMKESAKSKEDLEMLNKGWQIELEKKDKQIDLMAETIRNLAISLANYKGSYDKETINFTGNIKDIKQCFERKSDK